MKSLLFALLLSCVCAINIHLVGIKKTGDASYAHIKIEQPKPPHTVYLMHNRDKILVECWKKNSLGAITTTRNDIAYKLPDDAKRRMFYSFVLVEGKNQHYSDPIYHNASGDWLMGNAADQEARLEENSSGSGVLYLTAYLFMFCILL